MKLATRELEKKNPEKVTKNNQISEASSEKKRYGLELFDFKKIFSAFLRLFIKVKKTN